MGFFGRRRRNEGAGDQRCDRQNSENPQKMGVTPVTQGRKKRQSV
jgi:hypothetical protein